ncbi:hypothetical protein [Oryza sativa Japonica Group]|uniref:Uncharacterized protein n=1 Tax=Oryza sativa subsp. japonica TaxID=39947 RepID=Q5N8I6_ORYSJ|nr:hypothetical protein [Oryza sativa Japonica Group]BAD82211.1 hypothetical protein [Oryza sativa Japonica Group]
MVVWVVQAHCGLMAVTRDSGYGSGDRQVGLARRRSAWAAQRRRHRSEHQAAVQFSTRSSRHGRVVDSGAAARQWLNGYRRLAASRLTEENEGQNILRIDYSTSV